MTNLAPISVALKFGFLAVLYVFLLWIARSAMRDLRAGRAVAATEGATGFHSATAPLHTARDARLVEIVREVAAKHGATPAQVGQHDRDGRQAIGVKAQARDRRGIRRLIRHRRWTLSQCATASASRSDRSG